MQRYHKIFKESMTVEEDAGSYDNRNHNASTCTFEGFTLGILKRKYCGYALFVSERDVTFYGGNAPQDGFPVSGEDTWTQHSRI